MSLTKVSYSMIDGASVNVLDFGATGDGTTDDTAAIQAAIDSLPFDGGDIYFPVGVYIITSAIEIYDKSRVSLIGQSMPRADNITELTGACIVNTGTGYAIDIDSSIYPSERRQVALRKLHVRGSSTSDHIIRLETMNYCLIEDCYLYGANGTNKTALSLNQVVELWVVRTTMQNCYWGVLYDDVGVDYLNASTFLNCSITQNQYGGATIQGQNVNFFGCNFEGQPRGIEIGVLTALSTRAINLIGCYWEGNNVECIRAGTNAAVTGLTVQGCYFNPSTAASRIAYFGNVSNLTWTGNAINAGATPTEYVRFDAPNNVFVQDFALSIGSSLILGSATNYMINGITSTDVVPTTYTPTVFAETGSITSYTANGLYTQKGSIVTANIRIIISNVGTGSGKCYFSLPDVTFTSTAVAMGIGKEVALTDDALIVQTTSNNNDAYLVKYDGSTALATGATFNVTVTFIV